jgi:hypothetical protein
MDDPCTDQGRSMQRNIVVMIALAMTLTACASQPTGVSLDQAVKFREQGLVVGDVKGAAKIALKTKAQAVGSFVLSSVAASAVASTPASISPQGLQEAQEGGMAAGYVTQRTLDAIGNHVQQAQTPATAMAAAIHRSPDALEVHAGNAAYHVEIKQTLWLLSYDSMFGSDNYRLHWQLNASVRDGADKIITTSVCQGDGDTKQALDAWKANDYAKVQDAAREVGENCARQFMGDIGLRG